MFFFPARMIHCSFLCKQWVDPCWISGSSTAPIPGLASSSSTLLSPHPLYPSCSKAQVQEQTRGSCKILVECGGEREPQCALSRALDAGELPGTGHPSLPGTPEPTQPLQAPFPQQERSPRAVSSRPGAEESVMLRVNWLSLSTVP